MQTVTIEMHRAGQPKAYADSFYEYTIKFSWQPSEHEAKRFANAVRPFNEAEDRNYFDGRLDVWQQIDKNTYRFLVVEAFTD